VAARFKAGQTVHARNIHPTGHTRLPRYARGKLGTIHLDHGVHTSPTPAPIPSARIRNTFTRCGLPRVSRGRQASSRDAVYLDMWDDYLECV
jgi:hypothetical protein